jgi:hypothetical protein
MKTKMLTIVLGILCLFLLTKMYSKDQHLKDLKDCAIQLKAANNRADSLEGELLPLQIELGRYEVAYQIFMERNPKAAEQYGTIISEETE